MVLSAGRAMTASMSEDHDIELIAERAKWKLTVTQVKWLRA
jgi:hypothetical protein